MKSYRMAALLALCLGHGLPAMAFDPEGGGGHTAAVLVTVAAKAAAQGAVAPELQWPDLDGRTRHLKEWRGQPLLVNYWASWCGPCIKEMPELDAFARSQPARGGIRVLGIALDEPATARAFLARAPVGYPVLVEAVPEGEPGSSAHFGNTHGVLPYTVLLDAQGRVLRTKLGPVTAAELADWRRALVP